MLPDEFELPSYQKMNDANYLTKTIEPGPNDSILNPAQEEEFRLPPIINKTRNLDTNDDFFPKNEPLNFLQANKIKKSVTQAIINIANDDDDPQIEFLDQKQ